MIKAALFDLDGTLLDTNELILSSFKHTLKTALNLQVEEREITKHFGQPLQYTFEQYGASNCDELIRIYRAYNEEKHDTMCLAFEGVKEMLIELKSMGIKTAIVTSKRKALCERGLKIAGIIDLFDVIITPESTEKHKPAGEPALKACDILGVLPEEAIMIGDSHIDIQCGKNANCKTVAVKYTVLPIEELEKKEPDYFIDKPADLLQIIKKINAA